MRFIFVAKIVRKFSDYLLLYNLIINKDMYKLKFCFQNIKECPHTILNLILNANEDITLKSNSKVCKTKTIGNNYYLISEYNRVLHKYNYIKVFEKVE